MIEADFFTRTPEICARELVGAEFYWDGCSGKVVETEAYAAEGDPACHTFSRPSARTFVESMPAGTAYVYLNYGIHWLFNVLVKGGSMSGFVLLRALEPADGQALMRQRRGRRHQRELCSGPGRLTQALGIDGSSHGCDFLGVEGRGFLEASAPQLVAEAPRIGISKGTDLPWRYCSRSSKCLSRPCHD